MKNTLIVAMCLLMVMIAATSCKVNEKNLSVNPKRNDLRIFADSIKKSDGITDDLEEQLQFYSDDDYDGDSNSTANLRDTLMVLTAMALNQDSVEIIDGVLYRPDRNVYKIVIRPLLKGTKYKRVNGRLFISYSEPNGGDTITIALAYKPEAYQLDWKQDGNFRTVDGFINGRPAKIIINKMGASNFLLFRIKEGKLNTKTIVANGSDVKNKNSTTTNQNSNSNSSSDWDALNKMNNQNNTNTNSNDSNQNNDSDKIPD